MNEAEISDLVDDFLAKQSPQFSEFWKVDIVSRLRDLEAEAEVFAGCRDDEHDNERRRVLVRTKCEVIHEQKLKQLLQKCESLLEDKSQLDYQLVNQLVYDAYYKWLKTFRPEKGKRSKNPELHWLMFLVDQATSNHFRRKDARLEYVKYEENFGFAVDPTAQQRLDDIIREKHGCHLADEDQTVNFRVINSRAGGPLNSGERKRVASVASLEILRHYVLTKRARPPRTIDDLPPLIGSHQRSLTNFVNFYRGYNLDLNLSLLDTGSVTGYFKMRHHVLCNADSRRWMELAVFKLRESAEKTRQDLLKAGLGSKTKESGGQFPAPVGVAVCTSGKVYTCFKGGFDEPESRDGKGRGVTSKGRCENCPIIDLPKDELLMLKGGTLYLTHGPCGRRWSPGGGWNGEAEIPCEVRYVEAGFGHFYIGSFDHGNSPRWDEIEVLRTGAYVFKLERGEHAGEEAAAGSALLEKYFQEKGYPLIEDTEECRKYKIGEPANVAFFNADLMFEIYNLNAGFQRRQGHGNDSEPLSDLYELSTN